MELNDIAVLSLKEAKLKMGAIHKGKPWSAARRAAQRGVHV